MKIIIKQKDVPIGHQQHKSGTGPHKDKRTKRNRTRSDKNRKAINEQREEKGT